MRRKRKEIDKIKYALVSFLGLGFVLLLMLLIVFYHLQGKGIFGKCVAVLHLDGEITTSGEEGGMFVPGKPGSEEIAETIKELGKREDVASVVLVINSPGGSVVATREIYNAYKNLHKPKVAYLREIATSGAYYVASGSDYIIADPDTITGSIGVIALFSDFRGLLEKIGVNFTAVKSGEHKDIGAFYKGLNEEEKKIVGEMLKEVFEEFKNVVIENRGKKLDMEKFEEILDGRIISGRQAYRIGLVDELGSKEDAIKKAAELGGIEYEKEPPVCEIHYPSESTSLFGETFFSKLKEMSEKKIVIKFE